MTPSLPNFLLIVTDQQRADWVGYERPGVVDTPNLDALAAGGARFARAYCTAPVCGPSRISLATGNLARRSGAINNWSRLPLTASTYYQRLRALGYRVGFTGKIDLFRGGFSRQPIDDPLARLHAAGFTDPRPIESAKTPAWSDAVIERRRASGELGPYSRYLDGLGLLEVLCEHGRQWASGAVEGELSQWMESGERWALWKDGIVPPAFYDDSVLPTEHCLDSFVGRSAVAMLEEYLGRDTPWHLQVNFPSPHTPFHPPREYGERYRTRRMPPAIVDDLAGKPSWQQRRFDGEGWTPAEEVARVRRQYSATIELLDDWLGRFVELLRSHGRLDDTLIVFTSDHGEMLGDRGYFMKCCFYEQAVRVPLVMRGPHVTSGLVSDALVELHDVAPTFLELAGTAFADPVDAVSLVPVLSGSRAHHRDSVVSEYYFGRMARDERWKFVFNDNDLPELYDLEEDPDELANVAEARPDDAKRFYRTLMERLGQAAS